MQCAGPGPQRLKSTVQSLQNARVGVVGDFCLDVYWALDLTASEISVETGLQTRPVRTQRTSLGGAGNVVANLVALGTGTVRAFPVVGTDMFGERIVQLLEAMQVDCSGTVRVKDEDAWQTLAYCKPYVGLQEEPRIDMGNFNTLSDDACEDLLRGLERALPTLDVVIVNQQVRTGIHTPFLRRALAALMQRHPECPFILDARDIPEAYPAAWLKLNDREAAGLCGHLVLPGDVVLEREVRHAAEVLYSRRGQPVFVTRGERGCILCDGDGMHGVPGLQVVGPTDTVGAGDAFLAALAASIAAGATHADAMCVGNLAARVTVAKLRQTGTASPAEILSVGTDPQYIFRPEVADDPRRAQYVGSSGVELVEHVPADLDIAVAIFDHDGTISTLRQGWESVMEPMMIRAILGSAYQDSSDSVRRSISAHVEEFINQTTGIQTLLQMQGLVAMVREGGYVPETEILDMYQYKQLYDQELMSGVSQRIGQLQSGELSRDDVTIKNSVRFVEALVAAGVLCYLASGTDQQDVRDEARVIGYTHLFKGGIYGAVGDVSRDAKREVLNRILADIGDLHGRAVTFGDGPVEIRETRRQGGITIGVASDEIRRYGLNQVKRSRLIRAGAHAIIPDFSQMDAILTLLSLGPR